MTPGTVAGLVPSLITGWRRPADPVPLVDAVGWVLVLTGAAVLLHAFVAFALARAGNARTVGAHRTTGRRGCLPARAEPDVRRRSSRSCSGRSSSSRSWGLFAYLVVLGITVNAFVHAYEEPTLREAYGPTYEEFCANVPRWPRPTPRGRTSPRSRGPAAASLAVVGALSAAASGGSENDGSSLGRFDPAVGAATSDGGRRRRQSRRLTRDPSFFSDGRRRVRASRSTTTTRPASISPPFPPTAPIDACSRRRRASGSAHWSPDSRWIACHAAEPAQPMFSASFWVMLADGTGARRVTRGGFDVEPVFSRDGPRIAFVASPATVRRHRSSTSICSGLRSSPSARLRLDSRSSSLVVSTRRQLCHDAGQR